MERRRLRWVKLNPRNLRYPSMRRTPPLSWEGWQEILHELEFGSPDTPERLATFARADAMNFLVDQEIEQMRRLRERRAGEAEDQA
jgi:hypothetical protein